MQSALADVHVKVCSFFPAPASWHLTLFPSFFLCIASSSPPSLSAAFSAPVAAARSRSLARSTPTRRSADVLIHCSLSIDSVSIDSVVFDLLLLKSPVYLIVVSFFFPSPLGFAPPISNTKHQCLSHRVCRRGRVRVTHVVSVCARAL